MSYQVFISFKNTENKENTQDRQLAEQIYAYLTERGINTFYSNVTLFDFGQASYKQHIDDALDEVAVMLVIGSKREFLHSKWCRYEWETYQQNILSNIIEGDIITYLGDMDMSEVPTGLRHYQSFPISATQPQTVGEFILHTLNKKGIAAGPTANPQPTLSGAAGGPVASTECEFGTKQASYYDSAFSGEYKRLKLQGEAMRPSDMMGVDYVLEQLADRDTVYILDVGCGYGVVGRDRFSALQNKVIVGVDIMDSVLAKARELNTDPNAHYEHLDLLSEDFEDEMEMIMDKYGIDGFDVVFGAYILQHVSDPIKVLRNLRSCLKKDGYVIFRQSDEGTYIAYGDDGLVAKVCERYLRAPGIDDRYLGRKLYHFLEATGYKRINLFGNFINTSQMDYDERMALYKMRFSLRTMYYKKELERDPSNTAIKKELEWMKAALDKLQEVFGAPSFWFGETMLVAVARKTDL
ncbi:MAG: methyltransferase domain-containing protein [Clostridia bacterium]|nr:methyltransferase domain-containing protein [Clostridia bacterium]